MSKELEIDVPKLHLVIGEDIPGNIPTEFSSVVLYQRENDNSLKLYSEITLPYIINFAEFDSSIDGDPRYFFEEGHEYGTSICKHRCLLKPLGKMKGIYRLGFNYPIKIRSIEPLINESHCNNKTYVKK